MTASPSILILSYGGLHPRTRSAEMRDYPRSKHSWIVQDLMEGASPDRVRSLSGTQFVKGSSDVLVHVDHDIEWPIGTLDYMVDQCRKTRGIVGALVSKRVIGNGWGSRFGLDGKWEIGSDAVVKIGPDGMKHYYADCVKES